MKNELKSRNFIAQGSILAIVGIICRLIGMLYRIPLVQIIGTIGNGYYTSAYSIYNILLIMSSYSLPTAISKIISVRLAKKRYEDVRRVLKAAFIYATLMGGLMCLIMYFGADSIAVFLEKPFCSYALKTLAPTVWIMAYLGVLRGYFQSSGNMVPTAISQLLEQIVNAIVSVIMAIFLFDYGLKANLIYEETEYSYAFGAAGGTLGTGAGALIALLFLILLMLLYGRLPIGNQVYISRRRYVGTNQRNSGLLRRRGVSRLAPESMARVSKILLLTLLPILISSTVYNISTVVDDMVFSRIMASVGLSGSVVFLWGIFGEYRILFNIPVAMANSLSSSVIPSLSNAVACRDKAQVKIKIKVSLKFVVLISMPAAAGLFALAPLVCNIVFFGNDNSLLINVLRAGSPAIVFFSISTITNGILQGMGFLSEPLKNSFVALIVHVAALIGLVYLMKNIYSVILANTIFALFVCVLNNRSILSHIYLKIDPLKTYLIPLLSSVLMGGAVYGISSLIENITSGSYISGMSAYILNAIISVALGIIVYLILIIGMRAFTREELIEMPMGMRLYRILSRMRLM